MNRLNLNLLTSLNALLEEVHVSRAAEKIHVTQSAMSSSLSQLREILSDNLLVRVSNQMVLTPKAKLLKPHVSNLIKQANTIFNDDLIFDPHKSSRKFIIGFTDSTAMIVLPHLMNELRKQAPNIRFEIRLCSHISSSEEFDGSDIDLAVGFFYDLPENLRCQPLFTEGSVCVMDKNNVLAKGKLTLERYLSAQHVIVKTGDYYTQSLVEDFINRYGKEKQIKLTLPFNAVALEILLDSPYVATLAETAADILLEYLPLKRVTIPFFDQPPCSAFQVWSQKMDNDTSHQWLRAFISKLYQSKMGHAALPETYCCIIRMIRNGSMMHCAHVNLHGEFDFRRHSANEPEFDVQKILELEVV